MNSRQWHDKFPKNRKTPLYRKKPLWHKTIVSFAVTITSHIIQDKHIINFKWKHSKSHLKYYFLPQITLEAWVMFCVYVHSYSTQKCKVYVTKNVLDRKSSLYFLHCVFCILFNNERRRCRFCRLLVRLFPWLKKSTRGLLLEIMAHEIFWKWNGWEDSLL